jgi:hypothetical protein
MQLKSKDEHGMHGHPRFPSTQASSSIGTVLDHGARSSELQLLLLGRQQAKALLERDALLGELVVRGEAGCSEGSNTHRPRQMSLPL